MESQYNFKKPSTVQSPMDARELQSVQESARTYQEAASSVTRDLYNYFGFDVVVIDVNNNATILKPERHPDGLSPRFNITLKHEWNQNVKFAIYGISDEDGITDSSVGPFQHDLAEMINTKPHYTPGRRTGKQSTTISQREFNKNNKCVYLPEHGLVITTPALHRANEILNPQSHQACLLRDANRDLKDSPAPFIFRMFANVNNGVSYGDRYLNINDSVYHIPCIKDERYPEGVYVTMNVEPEGESYQIGDLLYRRVDLSAADKELSLYPTVEGAKNHHSTVSNNQALKLAAYELENNELKQQNIKLKELAEARKTDNSVDHQIRVNSIKEEFESFKAQTETDKLKRIAEIESLKAQLETASITRKDSYESSHYDRKNTSEVVGWLPKIVTGVVAAAVAAVGIFAWFF